MKDKRIMVIGAVSSNGVYGENGRLPWKSKIDLARFKALTMGHTIVMGRKTFASIRFQQLPNRHNIVMSRGRDPMWNGVTVVKSIEEALQVCRTEKIFFIGGKEIWYSALNIANEAYITIIENEYPISRDTTDVAEPMLSIDKTWPLFALEDEKKETEEISSRGNVEIRFQHWVR